MSQRLHELQEQFRLKGEHIAKIFREARQSDGNLDLRQSEALRNLPDDAAARERMRELDKEMEAIGTEISVLKEGLEQEAKTLQRLQDAQEIDDQERHVHSTGMALTMKSRAATMSLGERVALDWPKNARGPRDTWLNKTYDDIEVKVLMTTAAGWAPEVTRIPRVAEFAHRPIQVTDLFPVGNTTEAAIAFMEETTSTNTAAETAEGAQMNMATIVYTPRQVNVRKIAVYLSVTDEQLADVAQVQTLIDQRLRFFTQQRLDLQLVAGDGIGVNLTGLVNVSGIQTYARAAETNMDAVFRAMMNVQVTGRSSATGLIIHPTNWTSIRLTTANGVYLYGPPTESGVLRMWGVPVAVSDTLSAGTAIVGDFATHSTLYMRQGVEVLAGFINDDFQRGQQSIRATLRAALVVYRPAAFSTVTNLN